MWNLWFSLVEKKEDRRRRKSTFAMEDIVDKLFPSIYLSDVNRLIIISRVQGSSVFSNFKVKLQFYGFKVYGFIKELVDPHNGVKMCKRRRR